MPLWAALGRGVLAGLAVVGWAGDAMASARQADLQVRRASLSRTTVLPGGALTVADTTVNRGRGRAKPSTTTAYLSADRTKSRADVALGRRPVRALAPKASSRGSAATRVPATTAPGSYRVLVCADARARVKESGERNNCVAAGSPLVVQARAVVAPDPTAPVPAPSPAPAPATPTPTPTPTDPGPTYPLAGFGTITGTCGVVAPQLDDATPSLFHDVHLDFGADPFDDPADRPLLTAGGRTVLDSANAGGSAQLSEVFAFETLARCDGAQLLKTETEIVYTQAGKITDLLVAVGGRKVGVSIARAVTFPFGNPYTASAATTLINAKLDAINESTANVSAADAWVKQVLVLVAYDQQHADTLAGAWATIDAAKKANTIADVVVTDGSDANLY